MRKTLHLGGRAIVIGHLHFAVQSPRVQAGNSIYWRLEVSFSVSANSSALLKKWSRLLGISREGRPHLILCVN